MSSENIKPETRHPTTQRVDSQDDLNTTPSTSDGPAESPRTVQMEVAVFIDKVQMLYYTVLRTADFDELLARDEDLDMDVDVDADADADADCEDETVDVFIAIFNALLVFLREVYAISQGVAITQKDAEENRDSVDTVRITEEGKVTLLAFEEGINRHFTRLSEEAKSLIRPAVHNFLQSFEQFYSLG
ncbi:hypothetical protein SCAR479_03852 [Seiridium cardinale]|uniref:Uncharacterized protein n=1 Tax=Seiridium cardinale TaxID=138064 RepID=A0ABR2Y002_9PEZI